jgi:hypothetical protein
MGDYSQAAEFYDLLYGGMKDYDAGRKPEMLRTRGIYIGTPA